MICYNQKLPTYDIDMHKFYKEGVLRHRVSNSMKWCD